MAEHIASADPVVPGRARRCWRCRGTFAADDAVTDRELADWWTCEPCHAVLLPTAPAATGEHQTERASTC